MRRNSRINRTDDDADINLTPMLDVVFIMLIFFHRDGHVHQAAGG